jgi:hypothetical protein
LVGGRLGVHSLKDEKKERSKQQRTSNEEQIRTAPRMRNKFASVSEAGGGGGRRGTGAAVSRFEAGLRAKQSKNEFTSLWRIAAFGLACTTDLRSTGTARLQVGALAASPAAILVWFRAKNCLLFAFKSTHCFIWLSQNPGRPRPHRTHLFWNLKEHQVYRTGKKRRESDHRGLRVPVFLDRTQQRRTKRTDPDPQHPQSSRSWFNWLCL